MPIEKLCYHTIYFEFIKCNCYLLSTEYINNRTKLKYICSCGNISFISYSNFQKGRRCKDCGIKIYSSKKRNIYKSVYNYFKEQNCELLETKYVNAHTKMKYKCKCDRISSITYNKFQQGRRCKLCQYENNIGDKNTNWNKDRTIKRRTSYLSFNLEKYKILSDDINYLLYLFYKNLSDEKIINKNIYAVDHIHPRKAFIDNNLDNIYGQKLIYNMCNLRENLRIISQKDNRTKAAKYNQENFLSWFNLKLKEQQEFL